MIGEDTSDKSINQLAPILVLVCAVVVIGLGLAMTTWWQNDRSLAELAQLWSQDARANQMVHVPGGTTTIGSEEGLPSEKPVFSVDVNDFYLDKHLVTVGAFAAFVEATEHETEAEAFGQSAVLRDGGWQLAPGASWYRPLGSRGPQAIYDHPVTHVSWDDAESYCSWADKRLPTEIEWEHAARNASNEQQRYSWGETLHEGGESQANTWQGGLPIQQTQADLGQLATSPVGAFGQTTLGLTDMGGNVWEWMANWHRPYDERGQGYEPSPQSEKSQRGGSFLCHESYCHGYRVSARGHATPESSLYHVGFRCARDYD